MILHAIVMLLALSPVFALQISEIMYDPDGSDLDHEWVEIYNNDTELYNLSGWKLWTDDTNHGLKMDEDVFLFPGYYTVISQDNQTFLGDYPLFNSTVIDSSFDLSNTQNETVAIKNSSFVFDNITYVPFAAEGKTICRIGDAFIECEPTPGEDNVPFVSAPPINDTNSTNVTDASCDVSLEIETNGVLHDNSTIHYDIFVDDVNCTEKNVTVDYQISDLFGNSKWSDSATVSVGCHKALDRQWSPGPVEGSEGYSINAAAVAACNDTNMTNNVASSIIVVKGSAAVQQNESSLFITGAGSEVQFGGTLSVDLDIYRGNTAKYAVEVYVKNGEGTKVSSVSTFHANSKFKSYDVSVPVPIRSNCDAKYADGTYTIVAEGLDKISTRSVTLRGISTTNCRVEYVTISSGSSGSGGSSYTVAVKKDAELVSYPEAVFTGETFNITVRINASSRKNFTVYSYVYRGNLPVSLGFDGASWKGTWTANKKDIMGNGLVVLESRIEDGTEPGIYNLRVRSKSDKEEEITREVQVKRAEAAQENENRAVTNETVNKTAINITNTTAKVTPPGMILTGLAVKKSEMPRYMALLQLLSLIKFRLF